MKTRLIHCLLAVLSISFAVAADTPPKPAELNVSVVRYSPERGVLMVRFENRSGRPLRVLRPIDGSEWGWLMPIYEIVMTDAAGKAVPLGGRCLLMDNFTDENWYDDYLIQILPGHPYETSVDLGREIPSAGRYTVRFRYIYDPKRKTPRQNPNLKYPDDLWIGTATSAPHEVELPKRP